MFLAKMLFDPISYIWYTLYVTNKIAKGHAIPKQPLFLFASFW
ncbi:hypothetical protein L1278_002576 [Pontibacter sp. HSC-36F09]|nr:hypothetical protein [Pontibacter sp. HSC-36F09]